MNFLVVVGDGAVSTLSYAQGLFMVPCSGDTSRCCWRTIWSAGGSNQDEQCTKQIPYPYGLSDLSLLSLEKLERSVWGKEERSQKDSSGERLLPF